MNKTAIKNFAIWARNKLRADIILKAGLLGITDKEIANPLPQSTDDLQIFDIGTSQPVQLSGKTAIEQRKSLVAAIRAKNLKHAEAFDAVIEEVAYTWFNRLIAVRFMEVNDYLPSRIRVLSSENPAKAEPDFVTTPFETDLDFTEDEINLIDNLKDNNKSDELFQFLFIKQCNKLNEILPELFEKTNDYTELLLNVSFTDKDGVVYHLVHDIDEDDFNVEKQGQVEIIGWLYQYYNIEPKDKVFSRPSGQKIRKEDIPAATQLFTPDWIVRYMVENSLGRTVIHNLKYDCCLDEEKKKIDVLKEKWKYYLEEAEQSPEIVERFRMEESHKYNKGDVPPFVETTFLDPCMGSGHILVYAFDVFMEIYRMQGYTDREAVRSILENNLFGLEIDDRATQLAYFSIMMKARSYDRRFLTRKDENGKPDIPKLNICSIQESNSINPEYIELFEELQPIAEKLLDEFIDAKEYGSILNLSITKEEILQLEEKYVEIDNTEYDNFFDSAKQSGLRTIFAPLLKQAKIMAEKYEVVCTNPPYMGINSYGSKLYNYILKYYSDFKHDLYCVFIKKCNSFLKTGGFQSMITQQSFMFNSRFEKTRDSIINDMSCQNLIHLGTNSFEEINGEVVNNALFTISKPRIEGFQTTFVDLREAKQPTEKQIKYLNRDNGIIYLRDMNLFNSIEGLNFSYWLSIPILRIIASQTKINSISIPRHGLVTGNGDYFMKLWFEVPFNNITIRGSSGKWSPYDKGGTLRRWYGNRDYIVNWESDGLEIRNYRGGDGKIKSSNYNLDYNFKEHITWTDLSTGDFSARYTPNGALFDTSGPALFLKDRSFTNYLLGLMNTKVMQTIVRIYCSGMHYSSGAVGKVAFLYDTNLKNEVEKSSVDCLAISRTDYNSFETSWDFKRHPLIKYSYRSDNRMIDSKTGKPIQTTLEWSYEMWKLGTENRFNKLKRNEEELNRIFIDIYGLQDELTPDVADKDITVHRVFDSKDVVPESMKGSSYIRTKRDEIVSFISYAVGCMFGRYSLDKEGLIFAGGNFNDTFIEDALYPSDTLYPSDNLFPKEPEYSKLKTDDGEIDLSFYPDYDNCIPITDTKYFDDDIVGRFEEFVKTAYGEQTLEENLDFIAKALGNKGVTSRDVIRNYFLNDFFKDHCKIYQKRPIYWLFDSGKQNGFKALCYMHRWNADTIGNMRVEYLHRIQRTYEKEIEREQDTIDNTANNRDKAAAIKRKEKLLKQLKEAKDYDAKVAHLALSRPDIDLDDGVKVNYEKVQTAQDGRKLQILAKI